MEQEEEGNAITLLIEAHGEEDLDTRISVPFVELLSFVGRSGDLGDFGKINNTSLELHILEYLRKLYYDNEDFNNQSRVYNNDRLLSNKLRDLYRDALVGYTNGGFVRTQPISQRTFYFEPNSHENCRRCVEAGTGSLRCIPIRDVATQYCPVYGLIVVASSDTEDEHFTLPSARDNTIEELSKSNLHMSMSAANYWRSKIPSSYKQAQGLFDKMINDLYIELTELSIIFQSMGFTKIYILDPSCRSTDRSLTRFQKAAHSVIEQNKLSNKSNTFPVTFKQERHTDTVERVDRQGRKMLCEPYTGVCTLAGLYVGAQALGKGKS